MTIGGQIKKRIKEKGMSQNELAKQAHMSSSGMSTLVSGAYDPRISSLRAIAEALDCSLAELLEETPVADEITPDESRLLEIYRRLNDDGKDYIRQQFAIASHIYKQSDIVPGVEKVGG